MKVLVIEEVTENGPEFGISFTNHNPESKDYFKMPDAETANRLQMYLHKSPAPEGWVSEGVKLIAEERQRQVSVEGWTPEHDAEHDEGDLAFAAACYALTPLYNKSIKNGDQSPKNWPWDDNWWKPSPSDRIRELVKAGALIAAEIDRLKNDSPTP